jgi:hypothetical protein
MLQQLVPSRAIWALTLVVAGCVSIPVRHSPDSCARLLAEASAITPAFADSSAAQVAAAHAAYGAKLAEYHACLVENQP